MAKRVVVWWRDWQGHAVCTAYYRRNGGLDRSDATVLVENRKEARLVHKYIRAIARARAE